MFRRIMHALIQKINPASTFKIVGINGDPKNKNTEIIYQVSGKATISSEKPEVLICELMQVNGFSKNDTEIIYHLSLAEKLSHSLRILSIQFNTMPIKFEIEDVCKKFIFLLSAEEILSTNKILECFSHNDLKIIYFQLLQEQHIKQKNLYKSTNKTNQLRLIKNIRINI